MHLDNTFVRYLCVIIFKLFLVIQIMRFFLKIEILGIMTTFSIAWRFESMYRIESQLEFDIESS